MSFLSSVDIVGSALTAERYRSDVILQNLANVDTTETASGEPYRRKQVVFQERPLTFKEALKNAQGGVRISQVVESNRDFKMVYDPNNPKADENGYVQYPNVDNTEEMVDLMETSNAYNANLTAFSLLKSMVNKALDMNK